MGLITLGNVLRYKADMRVFSIFLKRGKFSLVHISRNNYSDTGTKLFDRTRGSQVTREKSNTAINVRTVDSSVSFYKNRKPLCKEVENFVSNLSKSESVSEKDWETLKDMIFEARNAFQVTEKNIETVTMKLIGRYNNLNIVRSYYNYLKSHNTNLNIFTLAFYLKIMYSNMKDCSPEDINEIERICFVITDKYPILDQHTNEKVILGLSLTKRWKDGLKFLERMKEIELPSPMSFTAMIEAAFRNKEYEIGWKLLNEIGDLNRTPYDQAYFAVLENSDNKQVTLDRLLSFLSKYKEMPSLEVAKRIERQAKSLRRGSKYLQPAITTIDKRGLCSNCKKQLANGILSEEEFEKLRSSFLNPVIIGTDIFLKTRPEELNAFQQLLKRTAPYDFIIDGLNVAYASGMKNKSSDVYAKMIESVTRYFVERKKNVLVIGRQHMRIWPKSSISYIYQNANMFLADNVSQDDPYLLYAALYSGINTNFVSRDLMKSHKYLLKDPEINFLFWRWQYQHQYMLKYVKQNGEVTFQLPVPYLQSAHSLTKDGRYWHVPCKLGEKENTPGYQKMRYSQWLCIP